MYDHGDYFHVEEGKKDLVKNVHMLARLGVRLEDSLNCGIMVHPNSESSLVVVMKSKQHFDKPLMELKESFSGKLDLSFTLKWMVSSGIKEGCVFHWVLEEDHGTRYSIHLIRKRCTMTFSKCFGGKV